VMTFTLHVELACTVPDGFLQLHNPTVFRKVSKPFLVFTAVTPAEFPTHFVSGESYLVQVKACGLIPLGTQEINPVSTLDPEAGIFRDNGRGVSGALGIMRHFQHTMTLEVRSATTSTLRDELSWDAGWASPVFYVGFRLFWWWRHFRLKQLAKSW
jgi:hypothetical protein